MKRPWLSANVSYCSWGGVVCCYTGAEEVLPFCQYGLQSVAWLMLPYVNMRGELPVDVFDDLPDLQMIVLVGNPGLRGTFPDLPYSIAVIIQGFNLHLTGFDQPCSLNTALRNGTNDTINVQRLMPKLNDYQECLPSFLKYDTNGSVSYSDAIVCPAVKWNSDLIDNHASSTTNTTVGVNDTSSTNSSFAEDTVFTVDSAQQLKPGIVVCSVNPLWQVSSQQAGQASLPQLDCAPQP
ncbi:hypothetical protein WJX84_010306 [Apatococcus fuscideae]|uniref:Variable lymphocyte receptor B n=1 Tax=Apatococcus fuscideae TaxID=2026836 RepID=A0AAW1SNE5_9CHLO